MRARSSVLQVAFTVHSVHAIPLPCTPAPPTSHTSLSLPNPPFNPHPSTLTGYEATSKSGLLSLHPKRAYLPPPTPIRRATQPSPHPPTAPNPPPAPFQPTSTSSPPPSTLPFSTPPPTPSAPGKAAVRPSDERANVRATSAAESERGASGEKAPGQGQLADVEGGEGRG